MIIYLIGPKGVGKTSIGKILANKLGYRFKDQDILFYKKHGKISDYIINHGWLKFYSMQYKILKEISKEETVIATGASIFLNKKGDKIDNKKIKQYRKKGIFVLLLPSRFIRKGANICFKRYKKRNKRFFGNALPQHDFKKFLKDYNVRVKEYKGIADIVIYSNSSPDRISDKVLKYLQKR